MPEPAAYGSHLSLDAAGRSVENLLLHGFLFTYWVDHAAREVRIAEILKV